MFYLLELSPIRLKTEYLSSSAVRCNLKILQQHESLKGHTEREVI